MIDNYDNTKQDSNTLHINTEHLSYVPTRNTRNELFSPLSPAFRLVSSSSISNLSSNNEFHNNSESIPYSSSDKSSSELLLSSSYTINRSLRSFFQEENLNNDYHLSPSSTLSSSSSLSISSPLTLSTDEVNTTSTIIQPTIKSSTTSSSSNTSSIVVPSLYQQTNQCTMNNNKGLSLLDPNFSTRENKGKSKRKWECLVSGQD